MLASSLTGLIWFRFGATAAFMVTAGVTFILLFYFMAVPAPLIHKGVD